MPLYTYKCLNPKCDKVKEKLGKLEDIVFCDCFMTADTPDGHTISMHPEMRLVLGTPSAPQWRCATSHSRSKGF